MKAQLIVVQGRPEGKVIPLVGPVFKVGRNPDCHLRPQSEQVSRQHSEFVIGADRVTLRDLGSRNGTFVNGKSLSGETTLQNGDLVQIGHLTFAVSIQGVAAAAAPERPAPARASQAASPDDATHDEINQWLVADSSHTPPETPSGVYGGDTMTLNAFKTIPKPEAAKPEAAKPEAAKPEVAKPEAPKAEAPVAPPPAAKPAPAPAPPPAAAPAPAAVRPGAAPKKSFLDELEDFEHLPEGQGDEPAEPAMGDDDAEAEAGEEEVAASEVPEDFIDESNPFYAKKKEEEAGPAKPSYKDSSDAAQDILRKMMERRRASKSS
jgi:predicted component of type VI protein secretion system